MKHGSVTTTAGQIFSATEHVLLAKLIFKRFGNDLDAAHAAWCRLLQNNCTREDYQEIISVGLRKIQVGDLTLKL